MNSEHLNELFTALSKAQAEMHLAKRESTNPFFKSKYADLATIWETARPVLTKHGLCITQLLRPGNVMLTILGHSSGQYIGSEIVLNPTKQDPQSMGACITYYRRFALSAIVGIATEDDDGAGASATAPLTHHVVSSAPTTQKAVVYTTPVPVEQPTSVMPPVAVAPGSNAYNAANGVTTAEVNPKSESFYDNASPAHRKLVTYMLDHLYEKESICSPDWRAKHSKTLGAALHGSIRVSDLKDAVKKFHAGTAVLM